MRFLPFDVAHLASWPGLTPAIHVACGNLATQVVDPRVKPGGADGSRSSLARDALRDHLIACGLIGEPVPPVMISGGPQKKNS